MEMRGGICKIEHVNMSSHLAYEEMGVSKNNGTPKSSILIL